MVFFKNFKNELIILFSDYINDAPYQLEESVILLLISSLLASLGHEEAELQTGQSLIHLNLNLLNSFFESPDSVLKVHL